MCYPMVVAIQYPAPITTVEGAETMTSAKQLQHFLDAMDRAQKQQSSVVLSITLDLLDVKDAKPMTLEFEILPPSPELTDTPKKEKKR